MRCPARMPLKPETPGEHPFHEHVRRDGWPTAASLPVERRHIGGLARACPAPEGGVWSITVTNTPRSGELSTPAEVADGHMLRHAHRLFAARPRPPADVPPDARCAALRLAETRPGA